MNITSYKVYDLPEAIVASGFPKLDAYDENKFMEEVLATQTDINAGGSNKHIERAKRLAKAPDGSGHLTFMSGILVAMNITATMKWWVQFGRYHFQQIDSSMSTMHKIKDMALKGTLRFHPSTDPEIVDKFIELCYTSDDIEELAYTVPAGLELTARVNTNYLQLRTMFTQRFRHRLGEWNEFCEFICSLPLSEYLILGGLKNGGTAS